MLEARPTITVNKDKFSKRVQRLHELWPWPVDNVVLVSGVSSDDAQEPKTAAMHHWLFGIEFPELVMVLQRSGKVILWSSAKKLQHFKDAEVQGPDVELIARTAPANAEADGKQLIEIVTKIRAEAPKVTIGLLQKEVHIGNFAQDVVKKLLAMPDVEVSEAARGISIVLETKDDEEVKQSRNASQLAMLLMKAAFERLQEVLDQNISISHANICQLIEAQLDNQEQLKKFQKDYGLNPEDLDLNYISIQSDRQLEIKHGFQPTDEGLAMGRTGIYFLSLGTRCNEYGANLSRTMMVGPSTEVKQVYDLTMKLHSVVVEHLRPGVAFKDVYLAAKEKVAAARSDLLPRFVKNVGFLTGLEFRDLQAMLNDKSDRKVQANTVFTISVGFERAAGSDAAGSYSLWLSDTVLVKETGPEVLTQNFPFRPKDVMFEEMEDEPLAAVTLPVAKAPQAQKVATGTSPATSSKGPAKSTPQKPAAKAKSKEKVKPPPPKPAPSKTVPKPPQRSSERLAERKLEPVPVRSAILPTRTREKNKAAQLDLREQVRFEEEQKELRKKKLEEIRERLTSNTSTASASSRVGRVNERLHECKAYESPADVPKVSLARPRVQIDVSSEALIVPMNGGVVPFHCRTIKNMSRFKVEQYEFLRVNFFTPGQGKSFEDFPKGGSQRLYVKELCFKSQTHENFEGLLRSFKEVQTRMKNRDLEGPRTASSEAQTLQTLRAFPCIRDICIRNALGSGHRRFTGNLEAHINGFRFSPKIPSMEKVEIFYSNIRHAFYEPCETGSLAVLLHFHLKEPMTIGKKRTQDVQFFTEVAALTEDLSLRRAGNAHDPDEILEEQREQQLKEQLNKAFLDFTKKVQAIDSFPLSFDLPFEEISFTGVPYKSMVTLKPTVRALVSLQEYPPLVLDMDNVDIIVFERALLAAREADITFVLKDYSKLPIRICSIGTNFLAKIKKWLATIKMTWYSVSMNMQWQMVMKEVNKDLDAFLENNGWDGWFGGGNGGQDDDEEVDSGGSDFVDEDEDDDDDDDASMDEPEEESSAASGDDDDDEEEESGMEWSELEEEAERSDKKRDLERNAAKSKRPSAPPKKKARR